MSDALHRDSNTAHGRVGRLSSCLGTCFSFSFFLGWIHLLLRQIGVSLGSIGQAPGPLHLLRADDLANPNPRVHEGLGGQPDSQMMSGSTIRDEGICLYLRWWMELSEGRP